MARNKAACVTRQAAVSQEAVGRAGGRALDAQAARRWARGSAQGAQAAGGKRAGRHGLGARGAWPGRASARRLSVLAGSAGPVWCTVHLAQF